MIYAAIQHPDGPPARELEFELSAAHNSANRWIMAAWR
jgi:hypothetical protein